jgi:hypothetical protein
MDPLKCPVCRRQLATRITATGSSDWLRVDCRTCGLFEVSDITAQTYLETLSDVARPRLSYWLRQAERPSTPRTSVKLADDVVRAVMTRGLFPMPREQADNAILFAGDLLRASDPNGLHSFTDPLETAAIIGASNAEGVRFIFDDLIIRKLFRGVAHTGGAQIGLSLEGWDRYEQLRRRDQQSRIAFMAMPFIEPDLSALLELFQKAVADTGFDLERVIDNQSAGLIDDQIRVKIRRSRFLICELTGNNQGAYWEAGFAEGIGIPVIYTCEKSAFNAPSSKPHFDTNHCATVIWDLSELGDAAKRLKAMIRATLPLIAKMEDR